MKNKILAYALSVTLAASSLTSCSDWLDINHDPNSAETVEPGYLFNYVAVNWSGSRTGGDAYIPFSQSIQCQADGGDDYGGWGEAYYDISPYSIGNDWKHYYSVGGNNLALAIDIAKKTAPVSNNTIAQCEILLAEHLYEATMIWGDIPFSEAWNLAIKYPKFDKQEDVLNGIIGLLDKAIGKIEVTNKNGITEYDPYFKGDMSNWLSLAKSLKFRTLMVMVDKDPTKAAAIGTLLGEGAMINSADKNFRFLYAENAGNENPKNKLIVELLGGVNNVFFANNSVLKPMQERNDVRIPRYFEFGIDSIYRGLDTREIAKEGEVVEGEKKKEGLLHSVVSKYIFRKDAPDYIYTYQEQLFLEAEAYARGLGVAPDLAKANTLYKKAISESCQLYGVGMNNKGKIDKSVSDNYAASLPDLNTLTSEKAIYEIHIQQWIDLMDRPLEEFIQWRRSGSNGKEVPALTVPKDATSKELIRRWEYSPEELTSNPNAPKESPKIWEKLWFDL